MLLIVQNDPLVPVGMFGTWLAQWQVPWRLWEAFAEPGGPGSGPWSGAIVLGGTMGVADLPETPHLRRVLGVMAGLLEGDVPQLGICLGGQLLAHLLAAEVRAGHCGEQGCARVKLTAAGRRDPLFAGLPDPLPVFQWHRDAFAVPRGATHLAAAEGCPGQAIRSGRAWGLQFHPEVDTPIVAAWQEATGLRPGAEEEFAACREALQGPARRLLRNFLVLAGLRPLEADAGGGRAA